MPSAVITNVGLANITNLVSAIGGTVSKYGGWGTGTTAANHADTDLQTPSNEARVAGTVTRVTTTATNDTVQIVYTIVSASVQAITETGTFDGAGSGTPPSGANLGRRAVFTAVNVAIGDGIQFTEQTQYSSAT